MTSRYLHWRSADRATACPRSASVESAAREYASCMNCTPHRPFLTRPSKKRGEQKAQADHRLCIWWWGRFPPTAMNLSSSTGTRSAKGTIAEGAKLHFRHVAAEMQCMACFTKYHPDGGRDPLSKLRQHGGQDPGAARNSTWKPWTSNEMKRGASLHITGIVQGVGFRPFVYNLAARLGLDGLGPQHFRRRRYRGGWPAGVSWRPSSRALRDEAPAALAH